MILIGLMFFFALALSGAAAYYSIVGLVAIFAASPIPIVVMGSILEGSKLVVASWLYRNWNTIPRLMKSYFTGALVVLMFLTSMGIFGYLSKAHLDQGVPTGDIAAKVALIDEKIKTEKENINAARQALAQLDQQVNQTITRTTDAGGAARSVAIRKAQSRERAQLAAEIGKGQAAIAKLNEERAPIAADLRAVEAEVGPIKYIAALIYGDEATQDPTFLEKAVRWVIILIVTVFDPLAVIMLIAANWSIMNRVKNEDEKIEEAESPVHNETLVASEGQDEDPVSEPRREEPSQTGPEESSSEPEKSILEGHPYLSKPFKHFSSLEPITSPAPEAVPETAQVDPSEHPVFDPSNTYWDWGSRPPGHLKPRNR